MLEAPDRAIGLRNGGQQPQESLLTVGEIDCAMQRRVGIEVDPERTTIRAVVNRDRQIIHRPEREIVRNGTIARETETIVERHDIDADSEQRSPVDDSAKVPPQVCNLTAFMLQRAAHLPSGLADGL